MNIGARLRSALDALELKISEASEKSGVPYRSLQNYLRGEREPSAEALTSICARLGISIDWLLTGEGGMLRKVESSSSAPGMTPRQAALVELFEALSEDRQREILAALEDKKRLDQVNRMEADLQELRAAFKKLSDSA